MGVQSRICVGVRPGLSTSRYSDKPVTNKPPSFWYRHIAILESLSVWKFA